MHHKTYYLKSSNFWRAHKIDLKSIMEKRNFYTLLKTNITELRFKYFF